MRCTWLTLSLFLIFAAGLPSRAASAAPLARKGVSASGHASGAGASGESDFEWPALVYGGNAMAMAVPIQIGLVGYEPRFRVGVQYDRQWFKKNWLHAGVALLSDRGDYRTFRLDDCGMADSQGVCDSGAVLGFDIWAGYSYKFYLPQLRHLVPIVRGGLGYARWKYPNIRGAREQQRERTWSLTGRTGGGLRVFLLPELGVGADINLQVGVARHRDRPLAQAETRSSRFVLGLELLPLVVEYRF